MKGLCGEFRIDMPGLALTTCCEQALGGLSCSGHVDVSPGEVLNVEGVGMVRPVCVMHGGTPGAWTAYTTMIVDWA